MIPTNCRNCRDRAAWFDMVVALALAVFKTVLGALSGSMALQAHSLHSFGDFLTKGITLASVKLSSRPPNAAFPYGFGKIQFLSATFIGLSLTGGALAMLWYNVSHLGSGHVQVPEIWAVFAAMLSAVTAELMHRYLRCVGTQTNSPAIMAAAADNRGDAYSSLAVLAGIVLSILGWSSADHLAAIVVSLLVLKIGAAIVWDSVHGLMDGAIPPHRIAEIRDLVEADYSSVKVTAARGRRMGEAWEIDLTVLPAHHLTIDEWHGLEQDMTIRISREIAHACHIHIQFAPDPAEAERRKNADEVDVLTDMFESRPARPDGR